MTSNEPHQSEQLLNRLTASEETFRMLVQSVSDYSIIMLDAQGLVVIWNDGAQRLKGYSTEEAVGKHFSIFYTQAAQDRGHPQEELQVAEREGRCEEEGWCVRKDGSTFWANVIIAAVYDEGKLVGFSQVTRDLTERRQAIQKEQIFRLLVSGVKDYAIFMLDPEGRIMTWNEGAERIKGYTASEIIGKHFSRLYTQESRDKNHPDAELEIARAEGSCEEEGWRVRKDGTRFWAGVTITAIYDYNNLVGFAKFTRDLTDRKLAVQKEELFRLMVSGVADYAIFMLSPEGHILTWNEGAQRIQGYETEEIIGKHFSIFYTEEAQKRKHPQNELEIARTNGK
ncbi:MAG: PAS domain S-box protein, partial [Cyanobacteria bacterium]|nr:PAS domain S-box protein [Cyanobacteriota bacterium]